MIVTMVVGPAARAADIQVSGDGTAIHLSGPVQAADQCRMARLLTAHPRVTQVFIDSPGGDAWAGAHLGRMLGWGGVEAVVQGHARALSAAAVAVMGAQKRRVAGTIGFHAAFLEQERRDRLALTALSQVRLEMAAVLRQGGMPEPLYQRVQQMGRDRFLVLDGRMVEGFVSTARTDRARLAAVAVACDRAWPADGLTAAEAVD